MSVIDGARDFKLGLTGVLDVRVLHDGAHQAKRLLAYVVQVRRGRGLTSIRV